jgi:hypothetical protein
MSRMDIECVAAKRAAFTCVVKAVTAGLAKAETKEDQKDDKGLGLLGVHGSRRSVWVESRKRRYLAPDFWHGM